VPDPGPALCLSGGGFRATLFHLGALIRLNEMGVLSRIRVITSVSGGSIVNGALAARWTDLRADANGVFTNFESVVADPVREFCARDLRTPILAGTRMNPLNALALVRNRGAVTADALVKPYSGLMRGKRLADLPDPDATGAPRFVFCATSVQTGACWHFHGGPRGRMGDFYTGYFDVGGITLAQAVAASSAFPPGFAGLRFSPGGAPDRIDPWGRQRRPSPKPGRVAPPGAGEQILLTDGGVYDNLGVEPVWDLCRTLVVSDAGHPFSAMATVSQAFVPRLLRVSDISAEQVGAVRKRWMIERIRVGEWVDRLQAAGAVLPEVPGAPAVRAGTLWGIDTLPESYPRELDLPPAYPREVLDLIASVRTDLNSFTEGEQGALQDHAYWLANAGVRAYAPALATVPDAAFRWPAPEWAPGKDATRRALADSDKRELVGDILRWGFGRLIPGRG
jgi:NTE family protein